MLFNSLTFVIFFAAVLAVHNAPLSWRFKKFSLLSASYLFYAAWNPPFVALLWISTLVDWYAARSMFRARSLRVRRIFLLISLCTNLGLLGFFKYGTFLLNNFTAFVQSVGFDYHAAAPSIILPVGISFYTFQTLSYTIDVYRRDTEPGDSFLDFALFVSFFPQLVAGPIVRAVDFLPQCLTVQRATAAQLGWGLYMMVFGLFQKTILADTLLAPATETVFNGWRDAGMLSAWTGALAFSGQIFFDFAGYSTIAIGAALCLGFVLPDNFRCPYGAIGFSDVWRRWHISLSTWLRDYLYISLGGNRHGLGRTMFSLMATMLLGGLWHGAAWGFVVWGALHGSFLVIERLLQYLAGGWNCWRHPAARFSLAILTFLCFCGAFVFFRADSLEGGWHIIRQMAIGGPGSLAISAKDVAVVWTLVWSLVLAHYCFRDLRLENLIGGLPAWIRVLVLAGMLIALAMAPGDDRAFVYFQF